VGTHIALKRKCLEVFARKEEQKEIGQLEHNKLRRLHQLYVSHL